MEQRRRRRTSPTSSSSAVIEPRTAGVPRILKWRDSRDEGPGKGVCMGDFRPPVGLKGKAPIAGLGDCSQMLQQNVKLVNSFNVLL